MTCTRRGPTRSVVSLRHFTSVTPPAVLPARVIDRQVLDDRPRERRDADERRMTATQVSVADRRDRPRCRGGLRLALGLRLWLRAPHRTRLPLPRRSIPAQTTSAMAHEFQELKLTCGVLESSHTMSQMNVMKRSLAARARLRNSHSRRRCLDCHRRSRLCA